MISQTEQVLERSTHPHWVLHRSTKQRLGAANYFPPGTSGIIGAESHAKMAGLTYNTSGAEAELRPPVK